nr:CocE/NonD family hydrolase [Kineococcus vitellinus]
MWSDRAGSRSGRAKRDASSGGRSPLQQTPCSRNTGNSRRRCTRRTVPGRGSGAPAPGPQRHRAAPDADGRRAARSPARGGSGGCGPTPPRASRRRRTAPSTTVSTPRSIPATTATSTAAPARMPHDLPRYRENAAWELSDPSCIPDMLNRYKTPGADTGFWDARDLPEMAKGSDAPLLLTQGFLEWNTEAQSMQTYLRNHDGPQRGWLGQWDHVSASGRGPDGELLMGREGWFDEVIASYDEHLKGLAPQAPAPAFAVQDSTGSWRAQDRWPAVDDRVVVRLGSGTCTDDGRRSDLAVADDGSSFLRRSEPVGEATRITGTPVVSLRTGDRGSVMVRLHDIAPDETSVMVNQQVSHLQAGETTLEMRSTDWLLPAGHTLAVEIGTVQPSTDFRAEDWMSSPSGGEVAVDDVRLSLELDDPSDDVPLAGGRAAYLDTYLLVHGGRIAEGTASFTLPTGGEHRRSTIAEPAAHSGAQINRRRSEHREHDG